MHLILSVGIMWILLTSISLNDAFILHYSQHRQNVSIPLEKEGTISCNCKGKKISGVLSKNNLDKIFEAIRNHIFCVENFVFEICHLLQECNNCTAEVNKCIPIPNTTIQFECIKKRLQKSDSFIIKLDSIEALESSGLLRKSRKVNTCVYPKKLMTADLMCQKHLDSVICKQKCLFGYTLKEGITRKMTCMHSENVWKPQKFEECRPYVDCSLTLSHVGEMNCITGTDEIFVSCNITCAESNHNPEVSDGLYRCQKDGSWSPKLPFCVTPVSEMDLVPAPGSNDSSTQTAMNNVVNII